MKTEKIFNMCSKKVKFKTLTDAKLRALEIIGENELICFKIYKCPVCKNYHLTRIKKFPNYFNLSGISIKNFHILNPVILKINRNFAVNNNDVYRCKCTKCKKEYCYKKVQIFAAMKSGKCHRCEKIDIS